MSLMAEQTRGDARSSLLASPLFWLIAAVAILPLFLVVRLSVPIGPMYWDLLIYFDAANRIFHGQVPVVDFFVPVGPLGYYLFAYALKLFPDGQPLLMASWSILVVTVPLMALVIRSSDRHSRLVAFGVLIPFLVFSLLPFNTREYFPYPGSDGFGIYNRQACQLLYVLVAALVLVRRQNVLGIVVTGIMTALLFTKITGFVAALPVCLFALATGRLRLRTAFNAGLAFLVLLAAFEAWNGIVWQYAVAIWELVEKNSGTLLPRFLRAGSLTFGIAAPAGILALLLVWRGRGQIASRWRNLRRTPSWPHFAALLDHDGLWLCVVLFSGIFFETQNTGSQPLIFMAPLLVAIAARHVGPSAAGFRPTAAAVVLLACAAALPPLVHTLHRAARTYVSALINEPMAQENLKTIGSVNAKPEIIAHADDLMRLYADHRETYRDFVRTDALPAYMYYLGYDFQLVHLMAIDRAVADIRALEDRKDIRFDTIMEINFVDPIPYLLDRDAPKYIAIGADPTRAVPKPGAEEEKAVRATDLVLYPTCPLTTDNRDLYELYRPALKDHLKIRLDRCFDAYVSPRYAEKFE